MKKLFFAALCAAALTGCASAPAVCTMSEGEIAPGVPEYTLNNGMIEIKVLAGVSGIVDHFRYLPEQRDLFEKMVYQVKTHDLLPTEVHAKVTGGRELIWGIKSFVNVPMEVKNVSATPEKAEITMFSRYFQGENIEAVKTVAVHSGTLAVDITVSFTNRDRKPRPTSLWKHLTAQFTPNAKDIILVPARSGVARVGRRAVMEVAENVIYHDYDSAHQSTFVAPFAPWIGRCSSDGVNRGTLVMRADEMMGDGAFHFTWKAPAKPLHTAEMILPPLELAPGKTHTYTIRYFFFPHLRAVRALAGNFGINAAPGFLELESVSKTAPAKLTVARMDGKNTVTLGNFTVPALQAGELYQIKLDKNIDVDNTAFVIDLNGEKIILPKVKK